MSLRVTLKTTAEFEDWEEVSELAQAWVVFDIDGVLDQLRAGESVLLQESDWNGRDAKTVLIVEEATDETP